MRSFSVRENWALYEFGWQRIKATDYIIKVAIIRGNIMWHSFALRGWAYKQISAEQPLLPSAKGLSFTFMYLLLCKSQSISLYSFLFSLLTSIMWWGNIEAHISSWIWVNMNYYCWHHRRDEYVGRRNYKPLSFYVSGWNFLFMDMLWLLAIIEDYMMVEYVDLPKGSDMWTFLKNDEL